MGESCSIIAHVKNSKGEVVESKLFKDLLHHLSDRSLAKQFYAVGTDKSFLDKVGDKAQFDLNGEITFNSLRKLAKIEIKQELLLSTLNRDIKEGNYSYDDAMVKLQDFNRNSQFSQDYMATIVKDGNTYKLSVVPRTVNTESELERTISNRTLRDRIMYRLNKAGVSVEFLEEGDRIEGRYSTNNAKKTADGFYNLIRVARGERLTRTLAEEAGHFAVGALGNSPLVQRLTKLLTPEVQERVLGEEYNDKVLGVSNTREVAGTLVGKAIMDEVDAETSWGKLATRIVDMAKRIFATFKGDKVMKDILDADRIARSIARDFMSQNSEGSIENALEIRETLYSAKNSMNTKTYRQMVNDLAKTVKQLKAVTEKGLSRNMEDILNVAVSGRMGAINAHPDTIQADNLALDGIAEAMVMLLDLIGPGKEINNILDSVDFLNVSDFLTNMAQNGRKLQQVHTFVTASINLLRLIDEAITVLPGKKAIQGDIYNVEITDYLGNIVSVDLSAVMRTLTLVNEALVKELMNKEKQFFLRFLEDSIGSKYVYQSSKVIWNIGKKIRNPEGKTKWMTVRKGGRVDISSVLENLESDINLFERWLGSMSNNPDIIGLIVDKVTKASNKRADDATNMAQDELRVLRERFKMIPGAKTEDLYERFDDGTFTGNIISPVHWGRYERDWEEFKRSEFENFKLNTPNLDSMSEFEKALLWDSHFRPLAKSWRKSHSKWDKANNRYVPDPVMYDNSAVYNEFISKEFAESFYIDYMELKHDLDKKIPEGSTTPVRLPQFKGGYIDRVRNKSVTMGKVKARTESVRGMLRDTFCENSEDTDFGSDLTYNSEEEELFANNLAHEKEKIHRIPLYGINKLKDMTELSTDIFRTTLAYAGMANTYAALNSIVSTLEVGTTVLKELRRVGDDTIEKDRKTPSNAYTRMLKFIDKQVYGVSSSKTVIFKGIVAEKVIMALTKFASKYFLGGNTMGAAVNTMTGFVELTKEAIAGEHFTLEDFTKAHAIYFKSLIPNMFEAGKEIKENKVSLFIRHFNSLGENRSDYRNWGTRGGDWRRVYNMFNRSLFLPYKSGDHYMLSMAYITLARKIKVYDSKGNKISLFNAYVKDDIDLIRSNSKTLKLGDTFFKSKYGQREYNMINSIIEKIENSIAGGPFRTPINLTTEELDYVNKNGYNIASTDNTLKLLKDKAESLTWNTDDETSFMDKCREINNRLHGIYNNQDKTAFHQNWFGQALLSMRGYALGMLERRFAPGHHSLALGHDVEGSLVTLSKVALSSELKLWSKLAAIAMPVNFLGLPIGKKARMAMYKAGFSQNQVANMRRNWGDCLFIMFFMLLKSLCAKDPDDDDEYDDQAMGLIYYFSSRLYRELAAFNTPRGFYEERSTLTDLNPVGVSALKDFLTLGYEYTMIPFADEEDSSVFYQQKKEGKYEEGEAKAYFHFKRMFPYLRSVYTWKYPYEAAKSYEYGKSIKQR